jgi:hypothetical protein
VAKPAAPNAAKATVTSVTTTFRRATDTSPTHQLRDHLLTLGAMVLFCAITVLLSRSPLWGFIDAALAQIAAAHRRG